MSYKTKESPVDLHRIFPIQDYPIQRFRRRESLYQAGTGANKLYLVRSGIVQEFQEDPESGKRHILSISTAHSPQLLGYEALLPTQDTNRLYAGEYMTTAEAVIPVEAQPIRATDLWSRMRNDPELLLQLCQQMSATVRKRQEKQATLHFLSVSARLADVLTKIALLLDEYIPSDQSTLKVSYFSQFELADYIGGTQQFVNKVLGGWEKRGLIKRDRRSIFLSDQTALNKLSCDRRSSLELPN